MNVSRFNPHTILLKNGKVLILGGVKELGGYIPEIFNPENNKFILLTKNYESFFDKNLNSIYRNPILLPDGLVYFQGAVFNPSNETISKPINKFSKIIYKYDKAFSLRKNKYKKMIVNTFSNGKVLYTSNCEYLNNDLSKCLGCSGIYLEDPLANNRYKEATFSQKRDYLRAVYFSDNKILIISPKNLDPNNEESIIEIFDATKGTLELITEKTILNRNNPVKLDKNSVFFLAKTPQNNIVEGFVINTSTKGFHMIKNSNQYCSFFFGNMTKVFYINKENILISMDSIIHGSACKFRPCSQLYDLTSGKIIELSNIRLILPSTTLTSLNDGKILAIGGYDCDPDDSNYEANDPVKYSNKAAIISLKDNKLQVENK